MVIERRFNRAEDFLSEIRRSNGRWWEDNELHTPWIFRGHSNSQWKLTPSAWRSDTALDPRFKVKIDHCRKLLADAGRSFPGQLPLDAVCLAETQAIFDFAILADELGWAPPEIIDENVAALLDPGFARLAAEDPESIGRPIDELPQQLRRLAPLAQHHNVPTRLLDWTRDPLIAAYFSVADWTSGRDVSVFALNTDALRGHGRRSLSIELVRPPRSLSSFLHAQAGLFTLVSVGCDSRRDGHRRQIKAETHHFLAKGEWPSIEDAAALYPGLSNRLLCKFTLSADEAPHLKLLLDREGIHAAILRPSFDNVAETVMDRWTIEGKARS